MGTNYGQLSVEDRRRIERWRAARVSPTEMAREVDIQQMIDADIRKISERMSATPRAGASDGKQPPKPSPRRWWS